MKVCVRCQTENSADYKYCKFCGAELPCADRKPLWDNGDTDEAYKNEQSVSTSEDISVFEMNTFVGKNCDQIVPKFIAMQQNRRKTSWCMAVWLLGLFFGFYGMAAWFFYRKMNKPGIILLTVGILMQIGDLAVNFGNYSEFYRGLFDAMQIYTESLAVNSQTAAQWLTERTDQLVSIFIENASGLFSNINMYLGNFILPVIMGFLSFGIYKDHALSKIAVLKRDFSDPHIYVSQLQSYGGTSTARVVIELVVYFVISLIISMIPVIVWLIGG